MLKCIYVKKIRLNKYSYKSLQKSTGLTKEKNNKFCFCLKTITKAVDFSAIRVHFCLKLNIKKYKTTSLRNAPIFRA